MPPYFPTTVPIAAAHEAGSATSASITSAVFPSASTMSAVACAQSRSLSSSATRAPARASRIAAARPFPIPGPREPAPDTTTTRPPNCAAIATSGQNHILSALLMPRQACHSGEPTGFTAGKEPPMSGRTMLRLGAGAIALAAAMSGATTAGAHPGRAPVVPTTGGLARGVAAGATDPSLGIPYAAPPVGALRWQPPAPAARWSGIRDAGVFAPHCAQPA